MAKDNVYRFRTLKWRDPERKLKMIPDALPAKMRTIYFTLLTMGLCALAFGIVYFVVRI